MKKRRFNLLAEMWPKFPSLFLLLFIKDMLKDCGSILDVGCGDNSPMKFIDGETYGVDVDKEIIGRVEKRRTHNFYKVLDARRIGSYFKKGSFDGVVALDLIEHLSKEEGIKLISNMMSIARRKVIIFTPNGFMPQTGASKYDEHISGWEAEEFKRRGFAVYGMYGPKILRGSYHKIRLHPLIFWSFISEAVQWLYTVNHPTRAASLLCVKKLI